MTKSKYEENRKYQIKWGDKYKIFAIWNEVRCLFCNAEFTSMKESNMKRHYEIYHKGNFEQMSSNDQKTYLIELKAKNLSVGNLNSSIISAKKLKIFHILLLI